MKNVLVISALVLASSIASAVTVRGSGRLYTNGASIKTAKEACSAAIDSAQQSLTAKCAMLDGKISSNAKVSVEPNGTSYETFCTAYAEADCE